MYTAQKGLNGPVAIRYPRGRGTHTDWTNSFELITIGKGRRIKEGKNLAILTVGPVGEIVKEICLESEFDSLGHYDMRFVKPLDHEILEEVFSEYQKVLTIEEGVLSGGFGSSVLSYKNENRINDVLIETLGFPDEFLQHGNVSELCKIYGLDKDGIKRSIRKLQNIDNN